MDHRHAKQGPAALRLGHHRCDGFFGHSWIVLEFRRLHVGRRCALFRMAVAAHALEADHRADVAPGLAQCAQLGAGVEDFRLDANGAHDLTPR